MSVDLQHGLAKNVVWLDTYLLHFPMLELLKQSRTRMPLGPFKITFIDHFKVIFCVGKRNHSEYYIEASRCYDEPDYYDEPDVGCILRFSFSIIHSNTLPKTVDMTHDTNTVVVHFPASTFALRQKSGTLDDYFHDLKVVIKMYEYENLDNAHRLIFEFVLAEMVIHLCSANQVQNMTYLLGLPNLADVFTGRFSNDFAARKISLILNAAMYSAEIVAYIMRRRQGSRNPPHTDIGEIINFVVFHKPEPISIPDAIMAYKLAYRLGLNFLIEITAAYLMDNLNNIDTAIRVSEAADMVDDPMLFSKASVILFENFSAARESYQWNEIQIMRPQVAASISHSYRLISLM